MRFVGVEEFRERLRKPSVGWRCKGYTWATRPLFEDRTEPVSEEQHWI